MTSYHHHLTRRAFLAGTVCACCSGAAVMQARAQNLPAGAGGPGSNGVPSLLELGTDLMQRIGQNVWVSQLAPRVWLHTTTALIGEGVYFPANGLVVERDNGSFLIDTGYAPEQSTILLEWSRRALRSPITQALITHFHNDRTGGIPALTAASVPSAAHPLTLVLAREHGTPIPTAALDFVGGTARFQSNCEVFFPGAGHTRDNIVVWLPREHVLFGGCFLKSVTSQDLGNLGDAVVADWAASTRSVRARYRARKITVPGHGTIRADAIEHTLMLLAKQPN